MTANTGDTTKLMPTTDDWEALLDQINASMGAGQGAGDVAYLKADRTRIRLVLPPGVEPRNFYAETRKFYQGKESAAYLVPGIILQTSTKDDPSVDPKRVRYIRMAKTILPQIVSQLVEGWDLFSPADGHAITIEKLQAKGGRTTYMVKVSPKPVAVAPEVWPEVSMTQAAADEAERQRVRDAQRQGAEGGSSPNAAVADEDLPF